MILKAHALRIETSFNVLKRALPLFSQKIKTKNNEIIRGKWQNKRK